MAGKRALSPNFLLSASRVKIRIVSTRRLLDDFYVHDMQQGGAILAAIERQAQRVESEMGNADRKKARYG
jgi:hypothetical protein